MGKLSLSKFAKNARMWTSKHSPEILTGFGIAGMITTTVLAVRATPKALKLIEEAKFEKYGEVYEEDRLTVAETVKVAWKPYIPAAVTGVASIACLIGATSVSSRRNAALATAYQLSATAFNDYREKVVETIGEKKEQVVKDKVAEKQIKEHPVASSEVIITERGNTMCYDPVSDRYFKSDIDRIKKAENTLNKRMLHDMFGYVSLNDLYDELGLKQISIGDSLGWNVNQLIDIGFSSQIADNDEPCIVLDYNVAPKRNYTTIM